MCIAAVSSVHAAVTTVSVDGPDAIFLAGRTDVVIPPANQPWVGPGTVLLRHGSNTPEEALEQLPLFVSGICQSVSPASSRAK